LTTRPMRSGGNWRWLCGLALLGATIGIDSCLIDPHDYPVESSSRSAVGGGESGSAGSAGDYLAGASSAGEGGTDMGAAGSGFGGTLLPGGGGGGTAGTTVGGSGGSPVLDMPPCAHANDTVSPGYLSTGGGCYRTKEIFDTLYCFGRSWAMGRTVKVNGQLAQCNKTQVFAPMVNGYNYFELSFSSSGDPIRWSIAADGMSCWESLEKELDQCADFQMGDARSYAGKNYICSSATCNCTDPSYLPGGSANAWTDEGACG